ncbi:MAG: hypothetical protein ACMUIE_09920 [Thermoplasmatota archaeon]
MRGMSAESSGIADLPMRLLITAVLMSLSVPILWGAYQDLSTTMTVSEIEERARELLDTIEILVSGGEGSSVRKEVRLRSYGSSSIEEMRIGSPLGSDSVEGYAVVYVVSGHGRSILALDPPVRMISDDHGRGMVLHEGISYLELVHVILEGEHCVVVRFAED